MKNVLNKEKLEVQRLQFYLSEFHRTRGEEWANGISHLAGTVFAIVALTLMMAFASFKGTAVHITSCAIYGATLIILNLSSTLYHLLVNFRVKRIFQIFDHCSIYILIAGTYTPFALVTLHGGSGWTMFGVVWGLAILGIILETCCRKWANYLSLPIYLAMGWLVVLDFRTLVANMETPGLVLLIAGGVVYTLGVIFFVMDHVPYMHTIWHFFVFGGNVCHWVCICFYVIPWN